MSALTGLAAHWLWLILAAVLGTAEMIAPGFFLIWIAAAALLTGLAAMAGLPMAAQFLLFAASAIALVIVGRRYFRATHIESSDPLLNDRAGRMIGTMVTAVETVDADQGRVRVGDSVWSARGVFAAPGERLRVTAVEGSTLIVERTAP
ncbi:MAG: NfeD family protein [Sphingomonadaceae bacterium]